MLPVAAGALALHALPALAPVAPPVARGLNIPLRFDPPDGVALTFDDGPHPEGTPAVLGVLADAGVRATFFLVGEQVERRADLAGEIAAAGHAIGLHCQRHRNLLRLTPGQIAGDLRHAAAVIEEATGVEPRLHRPPYGIFSAAGLAVVRRAGLRPFLWSRWGRDWAARATPESIARLATRNLRNGDVLLLHDADFYSAAGSWKRTVGALPRILDEIEQRGLRAAPLDGKPGRRA